jgi:cytochrome P450
MPDLAIDRLTWGGWGPEVRDDPHDWFARVRSACPVHRVDLADGHEAWLVMGHAAARAALMDRRLSKDMVAALDHDPDVVDEGLPGPAFSHHMLNVDPPDHTRLRRLVAPAFAPSRIAMLEPAVARITDELLDAMERAGPGGEIDLVEAFAHPLPFQVICELLGVRQDEREGLRGAFRALFRPWSGSPPPEAVAASDHVVATLERVVADHRRIEQDDLVGLLVRTRDDGEQLTEAELLSTLFQLIVAGHDTTTSLIGNGVVDLLDHPDQLTRMCADLDGTPEAIEELARFTAPVPHATFRVTTEDVELAGVTIPAHRQVLVCLASADRDPSAFDDPDRLDVTHARRAHLAFGYGIHSCLGVPLARLEARVAFRALLARFPDLRLAVPRDQLHWTHGDGLVLRGLDRLPLHLGRPVPPVPLDPPNGDELP